MEGDTADGRSRLRGGGRDNGMAVNGRPLVPHYVETWANHGFDQLTDVTFQRPGNPTRTQTRTSHNWEASGPGIGVQGSIAQIRQRCSQRLS